MENPPNGRRARGPAASGGSLSFRHPFQGRKPQIMAAMHEAFIRFTKMRRVLAIADLIGDDQAGVALRLEIPGVIEARRRSWRIAVPADARIGHEFVDLALERKPKRRPMKHGAAFEHVAALDMHVLRVRIPLRTLRPVDDVSPDELA